MSNVKIFFYYKNIFSMKIICSWNNGNCNDIKDFFTTIKTCVQYLIIQFCYLMSKTPSSVFWLNSVLLCILFLFYVYKTTFDLRATTRQLTVNRAAADKWEKSGSDALSRTRRQLHQPCRFRCMQEEAGRAVPGSRVMSGTLGHWGLLLLNCLLVIC